MKKLAVILAVTMIAGASAAKAGDIEALKNSSNLSFSGLQDSLNDLTKAPGFQNNHGGPGGHHGQPGHPGQPGGHNNHGNNGWGHNNHGNNGGHHPGPWHPQPNPYPGHPGHPGQWHPQPNPYPGPWHPQPNPYPGPWNPYPPIPPMHWYQVNFQSARFDWATDASGSYNDAIRSLQRAGLRILEQQLNYDSYRIVFEARRSVYVERYNSMTYTFSSDAQRAAADMVRMQESRGMVVVEKNVKRNSFSLSFFDPR